MKVAINGFGRIGRCVLRAAEDRDDIDIVAINDLAGPEDAAYLLQYDSVHGRRDDVSLDGNTLRIGDREIPVLSEEEPGDLPWDEHDVDIAFECTGVFRTRDEAAQHLNAGAEKVIVSAPPKGDKPVPQYVYGVNHGDYDGQDIVSNASCTTNSIAPMAKVLHESFGIDRGLLNTVHAYTGSQRLIDGSSSKTRRGRAAAENIVPTTTGAANATTDILPELEGRIDGRATRVPTPNGSATYFSFVPEQDVTVADVNAALCDAAEREMSTVMGYTEDELVSRDIIGRPESVVVDGASTMAAGGMIEVLGWYDNEYGFANRMMDLARHIR